MTQFASLLGVPFHELSVTATALWDNRLKYEIAGLSQATIGFVFRVEMTSDGPADKVV